MSLFDKPLVQCNEADLLALIPGELEGKTLEYKRDQVGKTEADRKEFLYDASSFANALGGHLIFGMDLDGLLVSSRHSSGWRYAQLFRDGCIEVIDAFSDEANKRAQFPATAFETQIINKLGSKPAMASFRSRGTNRAR
jgi:predicted HTH transcriptional regulator